VERGEVKEGAVANMATKKSSFDRIKKHLTTKGCEVPVAGSMARDMDMIVRRCDEVRSLSKEYGAIELSPYMVSLLHVSSGLPREQVRANSVAVAGV
jgi:hypothetical protein